MPRLQSPTFEFSTDQRRDGAASPFLSLDPADDLGARDTHTVFVILEPTVSSPFAGGVAEEVIGRIRGNLEANRSLTATAALLTAIESVNQWLVQANALRPTERRVSFGFTCVMGRGDELYIAQSSPSQILIAQEGEVYAFPGLDRWDGNQTGEDEESGALPLGQYDDIQPDLFHTRIEGGDLVVLCSTDLARVIERDSQDIFTSSDSQAIMAHLRELAFTYGIDDPLAAAIVVPPIHARRIERDFDFLRRVSNWCCNLLPEETAERIRRRTRIQNQEVEEVDLEAQEVHTLHYPADATGAEQLLESDAWDNSFTGTTEMRLGSFQPSVRPAADDDWVTEPEDVYVDRSLWEPEAADTSFHDEGSDLDARQRRGRPLTELLAGAILALSAAVVGVWQLAINRDRSIGSPRDDGTLGLPRLNRYDQSVQMPDLTGVRRRLPRAPISKFTMAVALVLIVVVAAGLVISIRNEQQRERASKIEAALQTAISQRQQAGQAMDAATSQAFLLAARQSVSEAEALGLDATSAAQERTAINTDLDRALHVERLANIQVLGGVPAAPEGVTPRIFFGNGQLFVFTDALYRLEANGGALVRLLGSGDKVGDTVTSTLQGAAWADGAPVVFDGSSAYVFDPTAATWTRQALGTFGSPYTDIVTVYAYSGNLYLLSPGTSQILKFTAGSYEAQPEDWTAGVAAEELSSAVDMEIDGRIYTLLKDGRIVDFYRSAVESTVTPQVIPPISYAVGLSVQPDRPYYYVADDQGRIMRLARDGRLVQQFMAPVDSPDLQQIRDLAVDDVLSSAYVLTDNALITVRLPGPPR